MAMPVEGCIAAEMLVVLLSAIRNAIRKSGEWSLQGSWSLLEDLKKYAPETEVMDPFTRRRLAAEYAELVSIAPDAMKVVLVYGLIRLKDARRFATNVVREIAGRGDALADGVLAYVVLAEAPELAAIDGEHWSDRASANAELCALRARVERARMRFLGSIRPPHTLWEAAQVLRKDVAGFAAAMYAESDPTAVILHLLATREYLGGISAYVHENHSELIECFPELVGILYDSVRDRGAALLLAMEAAEKLRPLTPIESMIEKLVDFEKVPPVESRPAMTNARVETR